MLWGSIGRAMYLLLVVGTVALAALPAAASALDLPTPPVPPPSAGIVAAPPVRPPVVVPPAPPLPVLPAPPVDLPHPPSLQVPDPSPATDAASAVLPPLAAPLDRTSAGGALTLAPGTSHGATDTPPPPGRQGLRTSAESSSTSSCQGGDCTPSLCPALVAAPLASGCATASRLPALIGLAATGQPVLALAVGVMLFGTGFLLTRRRRVLGRPSD